MSAPFVAAQPCSASRAWFAEVRDLMLACFLHAEDVAIGGADHSLALTHTPQIATMADFLQRHRS